MNKYEWIYKKVSKRHQADWFDCVIIPLAADLKELTGLPVSCSGPFGLRAECYIDLNIDGNAGERKTLCITCNFATVNGEDEIVMYYDTAERTEKYPPGSIGSMNHFDHVERRLPEKLEEILSVMQTY